MERAESTPGRVSMHSAPHAHMLLKWLLGIGQLHSRPDIVLSHILHTHTTQDK